MRTGVVLCLLLVCPLTARAQDRPFVFSFTPGPDDAKRHVRMDYDVGVGEQAFRKNAEGPEQRVGVQASVGRLTVIGHVGLASSGAAYDTSSQAELLISPIRSKGFSLALGGGVLHEAGGGNVLLGRIVAGRDGARTRLGGNLVLQKAFEPGRDRLDLITTIGWAVRVTGAVSLGAEAIGEDLEGFWDPNEAEGGARILIGPSVHIAPPGRRWQLTLVGGPTLHPTTSNHTSDALRDLPQTTSHGTGYTARISFAYGFLMGCDRDARVREDASSPRLLGRSTASTSVPAFVLKK